MKPTPLLLLSLPALISATCHTTGEIWDRNLAPPALDEACTTLALNYAVNQGQEKFIDVNNGQCYQFLVQRLGGDDAPLRELTKDE
ncbi:MAG: hypothetical protein Q9225_008096, partial [Loekoesia sp. 1 TL-2023]